MSQPFRRAARAAAAVIALSVLAGALSACVVVPARPGYCYWHPYRC